jgi:hypothetical protein
MTTKNPFLKISRNPTFSVLRNPQSPTLFGSKLGTSVVTLVLSPTYCALLGTNLVLSSVNLGTQSYVLRSLWNLLLSNSRLFSPGYKLSPRFLSPGNTRRVPVTRPPGTTSRSNSPGYPRRGALPHAGDYPTLTNRHLILIC